jgi:ribosomal protein S18 acetylase RimI-like enzyme
MKVELRKYQSSDRAGIIKLMEDFQDYLVDIDNMKQMRRMPGYGVGYVGKLLRKINSNEGVIYLAEHEGHIVGLIAVMVERQLTSDLLEWVPSKGGRILELFVQTQYRGQNIGKLLMKKGEEYLKEQGCNVLRIEVFEPNAKAHNFYRKLGYQDRIIDMIKKT